MALWYRYVTISALLKGEFGFWLYYSVKSQNLSYNRLL